MKINKTLVTALTLLVAAAAVGVIISRNTTAAVAQNDSASARANTVSADFHPQDKTGITCPVIGTLTNGTYSDGKYFSASFPLHWHSIDSSECDTSLTVDEGRTFTPLQNSPFDIQYSLFTSNNSPEQQAAVFTTENPGTRIIDQNHVPVDGHPAYYMYTMQGSLSQVFEIIADNGKLLTLYMEVKSPPVADLPAEDYSMYLPTFESVVGSIHFVE